MVSVTLRSSQAIPLHDTQVDGNFQALADAINAVAANQVSPNEEIFTDGVGFTAGTSNTITTANDYGTVNNLKVYFGSGRQFNNQIQSYINKVITFTSVIPLGITEIAVDGGLAPVLPTPPAGSVGVAQLASDAIALINVPIADYVALRAFSGSAKSVYVTGYLVTAAPSGIAGTFIRDDHDTTSADNNGTIIVAGGVRFKRQFTGALDMQWFGAVGGNVSLDTAGLQAAITAGSLIGRPVSITKVSSSYLINQPITVDMSKTSLQGNGATLDFSAIATGRAISVISTEGYPALSLPATWMGGFKLIGPNLTGTTGLYVGTASNNFVRQIEFRDIPIRQFGNNYEFGNNSYRIKFSHCLSGEAVNYHIYYPSTVANSGEAMVWDNCLFENGTGSELYLYNGQWAFYSCSVLNVSLHAMGQAHVSLFGGNIESPGYSGSGYRYVKVENSAYLEINGTTLTLANPGGSGFTMAPIYCSVTEGGGVSIRGTKVPMDSWIKPEVTDNVRTFVAGGGRVQLEGAHLFDSFGARDFHPIAESPNMLYNGNAETSNTNGWTTISTGAGATFGAVVGAVKNGTYGFSIAVASGATFEAYQDFPVTPGRAVLCSMWYQVRAWDFHVQLEFYTQGGQLISNTDYQIKNAPTEDGTTIGPWTTDIGKMSGLAPKGATKCRFLIKGNGDAKLYFDDVIVNVI